jgi:hypothetical protein
MPKMKRKLQPQQIQEILVSQETSAQLADKFGVSRALIRWIKLGTTCYKDVIWQLEKHGSTLKMVNHI